MPLAGSFFVFRSGELWSAHSAAAIQCISDKERIDGETALGW
jgi:hypothetical protein